MVEARRAINRIRFGCLGVVWLLIATWTVVIVVAAARGGHFRAADAVVVAAFVLATVSGAALVSRERGRTRPPGPSNDAPRADDPST